MSAASALTLLVIVGYPAWAFARGARACGIAHHGAQRASAAVVGIALAVIVLTACASLGAPPARGLAGHAAVVIAATIAALAGQAGNARAEHGGEAGRERIALALASLLFAALVAIPFSPFGWIRADGIHRMGMTDWMKHLVVTTALGAAQDFPPANPFLAASGRAPYYYGFHLLAAAIARAAATGDGPFPALFALTLVTAALVPPVLFTVALGLGCSRRTALRAALLGTFVGGFDLVPQALRSIADVAHAWPLPHGFAALRAIVPSTHVDSWLHHDERQFNAPYVATIWAPQHVLAALVALVAIHWLRPRDEPGPRRLRLATYGGAALLLGALPAISAYVALGTAFGALTALAVESLATRSRPWTTATFRHWAAVAPLAAVAALPGLAALRGAAGGGLVVHVSAAGDWRNGALFTALLGDGTLSRVLDTPAVLLVELGLVGILAAWQMRATLRTRDANVHSGARLARIQAIGFVAGIVGLVTFVRPPVGGPNNLYARPMLVVWGLLAPFAALALERAWSPKRTRTWLVAAALPCVLYVPYAVVGATLEGALFWAAPRELRAATTAIDASSPPATEVAIEPAVLDTPFAYWLNRRLVIGERRHALLFGGTAERYDATARAVTAMAEAARGGRPCRAPSDADFPPRALVLRARSAPSASQRIEAPWLGDPATLDCFERVSATSRYEVWVNERALAAIPALGRAPATALSPAPPK